MKPEDALRKVITMELDTVTEYRRIASECTCPVCAKTIQDIANEELAHVGEAVALYKRFYPEDAKHIDEGKEEAVSDVTEPPKSPSMLKGIHVF